MRPLLTGVPQVQAFRGPWLRGIPRQGLPASFCLDPGCRSRHAMVFRCWRPGVGCKKGAAPCADPGVSFRRPLSFRCSLHSVWFNVDTWIAGEGLGLMLVTVAWGSGDSWKLAWCPGCWFPRCWLFLFLVCKPVCMCDLSGAVV